MPPEKWKFRLLATLILHPYWCGVNRTKRDYLVNNTPPGGLHYRPSGGEVEAGVRAARTHYDL